MVNIKKITNKIINYTYNKKYSSQNYPNNFKYIINYCKKDKNYLNLKFEKSLFVKEENLKLASKYIKKNSKNFWKNLNFIDNEDRGYMHRWSWALNLVFLKDHPMNTLKKKYIDSTINDWFFHHQNTEFDNEKIEWYPYNISERISNYVILLELKIIKNNKSHLNHLISQMHFLSKNIEFYRNKKSNHALNNARAIFLLSCLCKDEIFKTFSMNLILFLCKEFMDKDGFFKFGSSHYQLIFTKWLREIYYFGKKNKVSKIIYLKKYLDKSINACNFLIQKNRYGKLTLPLFGNISPDFTPEFLLNYLNIKSKKNHLFTNIKIKIKKKKIKNNKEWIKLQNKFQTVYFRNPLINGFDFNHAHSDFFHFVNFYKGNPVFIDIGRKNYLTSNFNYSLAEAHNSIVINGFGIFDKFIKKNLFTKIGLHELKKKDYTVTQLKNKIIFKAALRNKSIIIRSFELQTNSIIIENIFKNVSHANKINMPLFLDNKINIKKIDEKNILLSSKLLETSLSIINTNDNCKIKIFNKKKYKFNQCKSYGEIENLSLINLHLLKKNDLKMTIKLNFLN